MMPDANKEDLKLQLTRIYVALTLSRNVAGQLTIKDPADKMAGSLSTLLTVTSQMLESILDPQTQVQPLASETLIEVNQLM